jgi:hypothetical protein
MFALGCIQSRSCHNDDCPTGVATQDPVRQRALVVTDKAERVYYYHLNTLHALADLLGAAGLTHPRQLTADRIMVRDRLGHSKALAATLDLVGPGALLQDTAQVAQLCEPYASLWPVASPQHFGRA